MYFAGFTNKKDDLYFFTFSDLYFTSNSHPSGLAHFAKAVCIVQCPTDKDDPVLISLEVNGSQIEDVHDIAAILMLISGAGTHPATHNYCNSIAKYAKSDLPEYVKKSAIIQNMIAASSGLNVAANT